MEQPNKNLKQIQPFFQFPIFSSHFPGIFRNCLGQECWVHGFTFAACCDLTKPSSPRHWEFSQQHDFFWEVNFKQRPRTFWRGHQQWHLDFVAGNIWLWFCFRITLAYRSIRMAVMDVHPQIWYFIGVLNRAKKNEHSELK